MDVKYLATFYNGIKYMDRGRGVLSSPYRNRQSFRTINWTLKEVMYPLFF